MKVTIRLKFFIVLLAFSLGPLLLARGFMGKALNKAMLRITGQVHSELLEIVTAELGDTAVGLKEMMDRGGQTMLLAANTLVWRTERALDGPVPKQENQQYSSRDFVSLDTMPLDAVESVLYPRKTMRGSMHPLMVSFENSVIHIAPSVDPQAVQGDVDRLLAMTPGIRNIYEHLADMGCFLEVSLESGVTLSYPGRGKIPVKYDPRDQDWYEAVRGSNRYKWDSPILELSTQQAVSKVAWPLHSPAGGFMGVVSVDVPLMRMLNSVDLISQWEGQVESYLVVPGKREDGSTGLFIVAQEAYEEQAFKHWRAGIEGEWMFDSDPVALDRLLTALSNSESGVLHLSFNGEPSVMAFSSFNDSSVLLVAPESVVSQLPNSIAGNMGTALIRMRQISSAISGIMLILIGFIAWFGSRIITRPLITISNVAKSFSNGDFSARIDWRANDERDLLVDAFNAMGPKLKEHVQFSRDLELAEEIQRVLLPSTEPEFRGFDISGGIEYCDQTGGDYYDFIDVRSERGRALGVVLADVSGHGVPAALIMSAVRGQLHSISQSAHEPNERIQIVNQLLADDLDGTGRFVTLFYLRLREKTDLIHWVRAGHDPAIWYSPKTEEFKELAGDGIALGVLGDFDFECNSTRLATDDILVMATDGIWEARGSDGEMFGKERMLAIVKENAHKDAKGIRRAIMGNVRAYHAGDMEDDMAVVVVKKIEQDSGMSKDSISFQMSNKQNCFKCFQPEVEDFGARNSLSPKVVFHLTLILDELVTNIIDYGYADFDEHPITVFIELDGDELTIKVIDDAEEFNILEAPEPELDVPLEERERPIGGMGIHLVKNMVKQIQYERVDGQNVVTLFKKLNEDCKG